MVLIANKCDLSMMREVSVPAGESLAKLYNCPFFETSAKDNTNITELFTTLVKVINPDEPTQCQPAKKSSCMLL
jgi:GTPase KRas